MKQSQGILEGWWDLSKVFAKALLCAPHSASGWEGQPFRIWGSERDGSPFCSAETAGTIGPKHRPSFSPALNSREEYVPLMALEVVLGYSQTGC